MKKYQYQLVRYVHDRFTNEFVNVGIVIVHPESRYLKSRFISKFGRISQFFNEIDGHYLLSALRSFEKEVRNISESTDGLFFAHCNIEDITKSILPKDDSALECSEVLYGIDLDIDSAIDGLFERMVNKYYPENENETHDDKYVWKNIYKKYFDKYDITKKLKTHSISTENDTIKFDKAWKNGIWHCYQAVSFDLKQSDSIKNKVYKWSGILNEIASIKEDLHIHFLTVQPSKHLEIQTMINNTLLKRDFDGLKVSMIDESKAEQFALEVKKEMVADM